VPPHTLHRSALACIAGWLLFCSAAQGQSAPGSVEEYRNATRRELRACSVKAVDMERITHGLKPDGEHRQCVEAARLAIAPKFDAAVAATMDPVGRAALQQYQAAFLGALNGTTPMTTERPGGYDQRQSALFCAMAHAWSEFEQSEAAKAISRLSPRKP
jgi:hypothetical protein